MAGFDIGVQNGIRIFGMASSLAVPKSQNQALPTRAFAGAPVSHSSTRCENGYQSPSGKIKSLWEIVSNSMC